MVSETLGVPQLMSECAHMSACMTSHALFAAGTVSSTRGHDIQLAIAHATLDVDI